MHYKQAAGQRKLGGGIGYGSPVSVQPIPSHRKEACCQSSVYFVFPVFGDSWSSQTDFRPLWCLPVKAHLLKHDFCCCGCSAGAMAPAGQRKANRAGHPLFTQSCPRALRGWEELLA